MINLQVKQLENQAYIKYVHTNMNMEKVESMHT